MVVVNTCGFLNSAKEVACGDRRGPAERPRHRHGLPRRRDRVRIREAHPACSPSPARTNTRRWSPRSTRHLPRPHDPFLDLVPPQRHQAHARHYAYLKISEGCNNKCSFCIIPICAGGSGRAPAGIVMREAERLVAAGVQELLVISQDTSAYGLDLGYAESAGAAERPDALPRSRRSWFARRVGAPPLCLSLSACGSGSALDGRRPTCSLSRHSLPACSPGILKAMRRPAHGEKTLERIARWREICPDLAIRSTFIVGFPGETEEDFAELARVAPKRSSPASAASNTKTSPAPRPTRFPAMSRGGSRPSG